MKEILLKAPVVTSFFTACVFLFCLDALTGYDITIRYFSVSSNIFLGSALVATIKLLSYSLGHATTLHLLSNVIPGIYLGSTLERELGSKKILIIMIAVAYVAGVSHASFFAVPMVGASGIVYAFVAVGFTSKKFRSNHLYWLLIYMALYGLASSILNILLTGRMPLSKTAHHAHLAGLIVGGMFAICIIYSRNRRSSE